MSNTTRKTLAHKAAPKPANTDPLQGKCAVGQQSSSDSMPATGRRFGPASTSDRTDSHEVSLPGDPSGIGSLPSAIRVSPPTAPAGRFAKDRFGIDLSAATVTCPSRMSAPVRPATGGGGIAVLATACPMAAQCTGSAAGRTITISAYEAQRTRAAQANPGRMQ